MQYYISTPDYYNDYLQHHGVKGMKWGVRKNPIQALGRRQAHGKMGQLGIKLGKKRIAKQQAKSAKGAAQNVQNKIAAKSNASGKSVAKKIAIAAGVATIAAAGITFLHPKYGKGNRMLAAGLIKKGAYTAASKLRDAVVKRRANQKMKQFVKSAPRIAAKKIVDVDWKDIGTTALSTQRRGTNISTARKVATIAGATAAAGAGAYTNYKITQRLNQRRKANSSRNK